MRPVCQLGLLRSRGEGRSGQWGMVLKQMAQNLQLPLIVSINEGA